MRCFCKRFTLPPLTTFVTIAALTIALLATQAYAESLTGAKWVRTTPVKLAPAAQEFRFSGVLRAAEQAQLTFLVNGELTALPVKIGDNVTTGQALASLRNPQLAPANEAAKARVAELQTRLNQARRDRSRVQKLREQGAATREEYEQVDAQYRTLVSSLNTAKAGLAQATDMLNEETLKAPFAGTISAILADTGDFVAAGQPVLVLSGSARLEIELGLPETLLNDLNVGQTVTVNLPLQNQYGATPILGTIAEIASAAPAAGRLFPVVISVPAQTNLRAGMTSEVAFSNPGAEALMIPLAAVVNPGGAQPYVFTLQASTTANTTARRLPIEVGDILGEYVILRSQNLLAGEAVIYSGLSGLLDGQTVQVAK